ncbi:TPA_asm: cytoplasmic protein, partial [Salmonella enterica subsp. enterica serovar Paratyphi A]|nr:cytoplasmic protein [Salmonella enterica subsp. enterica serovar Paratyphi A]
SKDNQLLYIKMWSCRFNKPG